jgi:hypothetical protein
MRRASALVAVVSFPRTPTGEAEAWAYRSEREDPLTGRAPSLTFEQDRIDIYDEGGIPCGSV